MRKVVFGGANSLDNYFARKDDAVDWLLWSDEVGKIMADYFKTFDTIVMGRRTYEVDLALIDCKTLKTGCVLVTYRVKHETEKKTRVSRKNPRRKKSTSS